MRSETDIREFPVSSHQTPLLAAQMRCQKTLQSLGGFSETSPELLGTGRSRYRGSRPPLLPCAQGQPGVTRSQLLRFPVPPTGRGGLGPSAWPHHSLVSGTKLQPCSPATPCWGGRSCEVELAMSPCVDMLATLGFLRRRLARTVPLPYTALSYSEKKKSQGLII